MSSLCKQLLVVVEGGGNDGCTILRRLCSLISVVQLFQCESYMSAYPYDVRNRLTLHFRPRVPIPEDYTTIPSTGAERPIRLVERHTVDRKDILRSLGSGIGSRCAGH